MNTQQRLDTLTPREREVLDLTVKGLSNKEMARLLSLSDRTIEVHRMRVCTKMGLHSAAELTEAMLDLRHEQELEQLQAIWLGTVLSMFKQAA